MQSGAHQSQCTPWLALGRSQPKLLVLVSAQYATEAVEVAADISQVLQNISIPHNPPFLVFLLTASAQHSHLTSTSTDPTVFPRLRPPYPHHTNGSLASDPINQSRRFPTCCHRKSSYALALELALPSACGRPSTLLLGLFTTPFDASLKYHCRFADMSPPGYITRSRVPVALPLVEGIRAQLKPDKSFLHQRPTYYCW